MSYPLKMLTVEDVAAYQMCCGCGACASVRPEYIQLTDVPAHGIRPVLANGPEATSAGAAALAVCPGVGLKHTYDAATPGLIDELSPAWGPVLGLWEGFATDTAIRFNGSSGGAVTALAAFALERAGMHGVLHTAARGDVPYVNKTVMSSTRDELLANAGSRYAPASPCDKLGLIEAAPGPCVFVGKPCDVAATAKARAVRSRLDANLGLTIAVFCAGTPSTNGTLAMLRAMGVEDPASVISLRYRGDGWPGQATVRYQTAKGEIERKLTYDESWGKILQKHRQWRCYVCADHTGEFADVAVGDPWYRKIEPGEPGRSLVLARTSRGKAMIEQAIAAGYLNLQPVGPDILIRSQPNLLRTRGSIWGRMLACKVLGAAVPRYEGLATFRFWLSELSIKEKLQSLYGTMKRVFRKRLRERVVIKAAQMPRSGAGNGS